MSSVYFCCLKKNKLDRDFLYYQISSLVGPLRNHVWSLFPINRKRMQRGLLRATCSLPFPWEENVAQGKRAGLDCQGTSKRGLVKWSMDGETMNIRCNAVISWKKNSCSVTSNYETLWRTITSVRLFQCLQKCFTRHFMKKPVFVFIHLSYVSKFKTHVFNWNT